MSGPSAKAEQARRRDVLRSDQQSNLRPGEHEPSTMHAMSRLSNDLEGRQSARDYVVGEAESVSYPRLPANSPWGDGPQPGLEPPTGVAIDAQEPNGTFAEISASLSAAASASPAEDGDGVGHNHSIVRTPSPTLHRPVRRL